MNQYSQYLDRVKETSEYLRKELPNKPQVVIALTGGVQGFSDFMEDRIELPFGEIPNFPKAQAEGHAGKIVFGNMDGLYIAAMHGRFHCYEGHRPMDTVFPQFVLGELGAKILVNTNASGGIRNDLNPGNIMLITDHINMMGKNPLVGLAMTRKEDQFTNMIDAYDPALLEIARRAAKECEIELKEGVYVAVLGPNYETRSEVRALRTLGGDAVGMSTLPEVLAARFLSMRVLALSCIANAAADRYEGVMSHAEVLEAMNSAAPAVINLLKKIVEQISRQISLLK